MAFKDEFFSKIYFFALNEPKNPPTKNSAGEIALIGAVRYPSIENENTIGKRAINQNCDSCSLKKTSKPMMSKMDKGIPKFIANAIQLL